MQFTNPFKMLTTPFKSFSLVELSLLIIFIIYLVLPIETPYFLVGSINSPITMVVIFAVTVYLFVYSNPILAILYIFVGYELLRRSASFKPITMVQYTPTQEKKNTDLRKMNPPQEKTLEEEVVDKMAPVGKSDASVYLPSSYKPVSEKLTGVSMV
jgi:hypothetical protein